MIKAFLAFLLVAGFLLGDDDDHDRYERHHIPKDLSFLDLSRDQSSRVREILYDYKHALKRFRHEKKEHAHEAGELFVQGEFDAAKYKAMRGELESRAIRIQADFLQKLHAILTPKQRKRFLHYFDEWDVD